MGDERNDGGPAFPVPPLKLGMSLRDWFAGMALQGLIAAGLDEGERPPIGVVTLEDWQRHFGVAAYGYADAMLRVRAAK